MKENIEQYKTKVISLSDKTKKQEKQIDIIKKELKESRELNQKHKINEDNFRTIVKNYKTLIKENYTQYKHIFALDVIPADIFQARELNIYFEELIKSVASAVLALLSIR